VQDFFHPQYVRLDWSILFRIALRLAGLSKSLGGNTGFHPGSCDVAEEPVSAWIKKWKNMKTELFG